MITGVAMRSTAGVASDAARASARKTSLRMGMTATAITSVAAQPKKRCRKLMGSCP